MESIKAECRHDFVTAFNNLSDEDKLPINEELYLYKGIMLKGKYGCGKTAIQETYTLHMILRFQISILLFIFIWSVNLQELLMKQLIQSFMYKPLVIDEFSRESKATQDYGNILRPIFELSSVRLISEL